MDINALQAFVSVAQTGSFSIAAERLFLTQPAISKRIAALEDELGTALFDRVGRQIRLTDAGRALLPRADKLIDDVRDLKRLAHNLTGDISGQLLLGTSHHIGLHRLPPVLRQFSELHPKVNLDIRFLDSEAACRLVASGELEIAIVTLPSQPMPNLLLEPVWDDPLVFVAAPDHPLTHQANVSLQDLAEIPAVLPGPTTFTRAIIEREMADNQLELKVKMSTNYLETIKMLVSINQGWSLLPATMVDSQVHMLPVPIRLARSLGVVTHPARTLSNAAGALRGLL